MGRIRSGSAAILFALAMVGCAGFSYRYYGLQGVRYDEGKLLGPKEDGSTDLEFSMCAPSAQVKHPCVVMFAVEFQRFKLDYEDTKQKLEACQKNGCGPGRSGD